MFELNRNNVNARDLILFGEKFCEDKYLGGIRRFESLSVSGLQNLLALNAIDPEEQHNCAPTTQEIYDFMKDHDNFTAHGYAVSTSRDDYRISLEGVEGFCETRADMEDFVNMFRFADEFSISDGEAWCWFD